MAAAEFRDASVEQRDPPVASPDPQAPQDSQALQAHLAEAREKLDGLVAHLQAIDGELEALAPAREQHRLLGQACDALEGLRALDAAPLFWGEDAASAAINSEALVGRARGRVDDFRLQVGAIEERRRVALEGIAQQQSQSALLEDDLFEALDQEERRKLEWIIEREISAVRSREAQLPWSHRGDDDRRFRKSLAATLIASILFALLVNWIRLPLIPPTAQPQIPPRVVKLMMKMQPKTLPRPIPQRRPPPPPVKLAQQKPVKKPVPQQTVTPEKQPQQPAAKPAPQEGLLAFSQKLAVQDAPVDAHLGRNAQLKSTVKTGLPERAMLTTNAPGSSGGIRLAALSRGLGPAGGAERGAIKGGALTHATSSLTGLGGGAHPLSHGAGPGRTDEEIQIVFDRHKAELYRLYNMQLRNDPTLQGKMILRLTIEPNGSVSFCVLQSTDMNAPGLADEVVAHVQTFDFGAKAVPAITIVYPIDFLPAT